MHYTKEKPWQNEVVTNPEKMVNGDYCSRTAEINTFFNLYPRLPRKFSRASAQDRVFGGMRTKRPFTNSRTLMLTARLGAMGAHGNMPRLRSWSAVGAQAQDRISIYSTTGELNTDAGSRKPHLQSK